MSLVIRSYAIFNMNKIFLLSAHARARARARARDITGSVQDKLFSLHRSTLRWIFGRISDD